MTRASHLTIREESPGLLWCEARSIISSTKKSSALALYLQSGFSVPSNYSSGLQAMPTYLGNNTVFSATTLWLSSFPATRLLVIASSEVIVSMKPPCPPAQGASTAGCDGGRSCPSLQICLNKSEYWELGCPSNGQLR